MMKYQLRAFQLSILVHVLAILAIAFLNYSIERPSKVIVIDFSMEDSQGMRERLPEVSGSNDRSRRKVVYQNRRTTDKKPQAVRDQISKKEEQKKETAPVTAPEPYDTAIVAASTLDVVRAEQVANEGHSFSEFGSVAGSSGEGKAIAGTEAVKVSTYSGNYGDSHGQGKLRYLKEHFLYIRNLIQKMVDYPILARKRGWEGKVTVSFIVASDGRAKNITIIQSSEKDVLDASAVAAVKKASPFPRPPIEANIIIPIVYRLN